ncbi:type VII secretion protein EccE [Amycolatopsis sp. NPDC059027]|uniref:type VII secretion protein EccE n=1 Tax=Amycolatopsis sp. NPDC059027 TaxID=3346709 RepID=UPI003672C803
MSANTAAAEPTEAAPAASGAHRPPPRPGTAGAAPLPWLLPIRPLQAAVWEIAGIAVLVAFAIPGVAQPARITIAAVAAALVLSTSARFAGKHAAGWALTWLGYRLRRHDDRHDSPDPLHLVAGPVRVRQHVDRAGNRFGVAEIDDGWSAIVRLTPGPGEPSPDTLVEVLRERFRDPAIPLSSAQLLTWAVPREAGGQVFRVRWLTVRYRPEEAPIAALARGGGELGALRSTACAALGLMGALAEAGYVSTVLEAGELAKELRVALGVPEESPREEASLPDGWSSWKWGESTQACFSPRSERDLARILDFSASKAAFTATSYTLRRTPSGKERADVTIRVGARPGASVPSPTGVSAVPLHGRHASAVRRTLPLALEH